MNTRSFRGEAGQMVIISVLFVVLLVMGVVVVVYLNQLQGRFGVAHQKRQKAHSVTQAGLDYALQTLANPAVWKSALGGVFPAEFTDPGGAHKYDLGGTGNSYTIQCSTGGSMANYQVQVLVTGYTQIQGTPTPTRALSAVASQKTLGATLPSGINASAALYTKHVPRSTGMAIHWGPIVDLDTTTWNVDGVNDGWQFPRKFSTGIMGTNSFVPRCTASPPPVSDGLEFWCNQSVGFVNDIDLARYQALAKAESGVPLPPCQNSAGNCTANPSGSGFITVANGDTALFANGYSLISSTSVIYVNGNAEVDDAAIDLKDKGAFIVTGNLSMGSVPTNGNGNVLTLRVPPTVNIEYPYSTLAGGGQYPAPCHAQAGATCSSTAALSDPSIAQYVGAGQNGKVHLRGFIYVMGDQISTSPGYAPNVFAGVMRLDGLTDFGGGDNETILLYDDEINHAIQVTPFELMIDSQTEITAR